MDDWAPSFYMRIHCTSNLMDGQRGTNERIKKNKNIKALNMKINNIHSQSNKSIWRWIKTFWDTQRQRERENIVYNGRQIYRLSSNSTGQSNQRRIIATFFHLKWFIFLCVFWKWTCIWNLNPMYTSVLMYYEKATKKNIHRIFAWVCFHNKPTYFPHTHTHIDFSICFSNWRQHVPN